MPAAGCTHVVAAAVTAADGRVLIAQRPPGKHLAGGWEFPGGKLEAGESRTDGLARELREELGIVIREPRPLMRIRHAYPYGDVLIDLWVVTRYGGEPRGLDGQALRWLTQDELQTAELLPADRPLVRALRLPERLVATRGDGYEVVDLPATSAAHRGAVLESPIRGDKLRGFRCRDADEAVIAVGKGADFLVMRHQVTDVALRGLSQTVAVPIFARSIPLESAWRLGCTGVSEFVAQSGG